MTPAGTTLRGAARVGVISAALISLASCSGTATTPLLPRAQAVPAGTTPLLYGPTGLGASIEVPATWKPGTLASAPGVVQTPYVISGPGADYPAVEGVRLAAESSSAAQVLADHAKYLESGGASIEAEAAGTIDGHPGYYLHYRFASKIDPGVILDQYEWSIIVGGVIIVMAIREPNATIRNWMASTIRLT